MLMLRVIGAGGIALVTHMLFLSLDFIASVCQKSEDRNISVWWDRT